MSSMTVGYYEQVKDYLHSHVNDFINYYRYEGVIHLPLYHGCNRLNRNGTRKEISYNLGHQCVIPTSKRYWRETKDKYKRRPRFYWTRYMARTNCRHLFKNKGNLVYNYKLKKYKHMSETPMRGDFYYLQSIKKDYLNMPLNKNVFIYYSRISVKEGLNTDLKTSELMLEKYDKEVYQSCR